MKPNGFIMPLRCRKKRFLFVVFFQHHLPISKGQIQNGDILTAHKRVKGSITPRQWLCITAGNGVKRMIVHTEAPRFIISLFGIDKGRNLLVTNYSCIVENQAI